MHSYNSYIVILYDTDNDLPPQESEWKTFILRTMRIGNMSDIGQTDKVEQFIYRKM